MKRILFVLCFLCASLSALDQPAKDQLKLELDIIRNVFEVCYAPKEWKFLHLGWELDVEICKAKQKVQNADHLTVKEFQKIVSDFFYSTKDYHVGVYFHSTEKASLPFHVRAAEGRYFITYVDKEAFSSDDPPSISVGDEILRFEGKPLSEVMKNIQATMTCGANEGTDRLWAQIYLTQRSGRLAHQIPQGPISIVVQRPQSNLQNEVQLTWNQTPDLLYTGLHANEYACSSRGALDKAVAVPFADVSMDPLRCEGDSRDTPGCYRSFIPPLGKIVWRSKKNSPFFGYIYENAQQRLIGYLRIPDYRGDQSKIQSFAKLIRLFQGKTDALVIDQLYNPGGNLFNVYTILSMLADKPLNPPKHRLMLTHKGVAKAIAMLALLESLRNEKEAQTFVKKISLDAFGIPANQVVKLIKDYYDFIVSQWNQGHTLTAPTYLFGLEALLPHPKVRYTKPIVVLINELDISGGDFLPAILQDNQRALLVGAKTAGGGGYVEQERFPNRFGLDYFTYTASFAERPGSSPIENLGVTPDIPYALTVEDMQNNYVNYINFINKVVANMLK